MKVVLYNGIRRSLVAGAAGPPLNGDLGLNPTSSPRQGLQVQQAHCIPQR